MRGLPVRARVKLTTTPLFDAASRSIGTVESVAPQKLTVLLDVEAPHGTALGGGDPIRFPRINGFVLLPNEVGALVGVVTWLGIERAPYPKRSGLQDFGLVDLPFPLRRLTLNPVGTLVPVARDDEPHFELRRGALSFPTVGDPVVLPTAAQLRALIESHDADARVIIGSSPLAGDAHVRVDPDKLFGRHLAILGNTGSGKSCSVAGLIRWSLEAATQTRKDDGKVGPPNARFIVLDPNGEYSNTFSDIADVRRFRVEGGEGVEPLLVPAWMWDSREWSAFVQATAATQRPLLLQALRDLRAGHRYEVTSEMKLARRTHGYRSILDGIIASGVEKFGNDFKSRLTCGQTLRNLATDLPGVPDTGLDSEVQAVVDVATRVADERGGREWQGSEVFNGFSAVQLEEVSVALDQLISALPEIEVAAGPGEDAPIPFDAADLSDHLRILSSTEEFSAAGHTSTRC